MRPAARSSSSCNPASSCTDDGVRRQRASGCLAKVPVPVHGTSRSTTSARVMGGCRASATTHPRRCPVLSMFSRIIRMRDSERSAASVKEARPATASALPPGAAQRSATFVPAPTSVYWLTRRAAGSCTIDWGSARSAARGLDPGSSSTQSVPKPTSVLSMPAAASRATASGAGCSSGTRKSARRALLAVTRASTT